MNHQDSPARELSGLRAIVLGSTSGIGAATALELARAGADVIIHGNRSRERAENVAAQCRSLGVRAAVLMANLADRAAGDALVDQAWNVWGGLDAWLHLAGADTLTGDGANLSYDQKLDLLWEVDVVSTIRLCRAVGERLKNQPNSSIITMGWDQAETGMEGDSGELFAATKGAVIAFTRSLALSLAPSVRVNGVAPGWIRTAWGEQASDPWQERVLREIPQRRWGTPDDVARVCRFLVGPSAAFLTGQILRVNGGAIR
jgi:3-oxoacyl-[acyl-carrier protein] reductase